MDSKLSKNRNSQLFNDEKDLFNYAYKDVHKGTITNGNIEIKISINFEQDEKDKDDGLLGGQYVSEYVKQLCASPQTIKVELEKNGHLLIDNKEY